MRVGARAALTLAIASFAVASCTMIGCKASGRQDTAPDPSIDERGPKFDAQMIPSVDVPRFDASQALLPTTPREDRDLQVTGPEMLAGASRGGLYRINTSAEYAFDRISHGLDGYYLLGVEAKASDKNGRRHRIGVKSSRRGVSIRSRRSFVTALSARAGTPTEAVTQALKSPLPVNDLPLKMSTWTYKDPASSRVRVLVAAEAERLIDQSLDYTVGVVIVSKDGRGVGPPVELKKLTAKASDQGTAVYSNMLAVDPGQYRVIV